MALTAGPQAVLLSSESAGVFDPNSLGLGHGGLCYWLGSGSRRDECDGSGAFSLSTRGHHCHTQHSQGYKGR